MPKRRIYYVPGLISLILLLPLLYDALQKEKASRDYHVLEVHLFDPAQLLKDTAYNRETYPPTRDYLTLEFTGDSIMDRIKLNYARLRIREIETQSDSIHGVNFHFSDSAKYRSFVGALDLLNQEHATHHLSAHKDIWFWALAKSAPETSIIPPAGCCVCHYEYLEETTSEGQLRKIFEVIKAHWPITVIFLALMLCALRFIILRRPPVYKFVGVLAKVRRVG